MFRPEVWIDLTGKVVTEYLFDDDNHFAGVSIMDVKTKKKFNFMPDNLQRVDVIHVDDIIKDSYDHTRLLGFRTTKRCNSSRFI